MKKALTHRLWALLGILMMLAFGLTAAVAQNPGTLRGVTFSDENANGIRDLGEDPVPNVNLVISGPSGLFYINSNASGQYSLNELAPGLYTILPPSSTPAGDLVGGGASGQFNVDVASGQVTIKDIGYHKQCVKFTKKPKVLWTVGPNGLPTGGATITLTFTNTNAWPIGWVYVNPPPGVTTPINPIQITPPVAPGASYTMTFPVSGLQPNREYCFDFTFHSPNLEHCCFERICFVTPDCDCFQVLNEVIECLPDGSFQINLTLQNLTPYNVTQVWAVGPAGSTLTPTVTNVSIGPGGIVNLSLNLTGNSLSGTQYCFRVMFYNGGFRCCVKDLCVDLPQCITCDNRPAICYAKRPVYDAPGGAGQASYNGPDWAALNNSTVSAVTCFSSDVDGFVFGYMNQDQYQCQQPFLGTDWALTPRAFHNGMDSNPAAVPLDARWTKRYMGNVFALTFDDQGNIYVAQTSAYNMDYAPLIQDFNAPGTAGRNHVPSPNEIADRRLHGRIFKIENITGKVTIFNEDTTTGWNGLPSGPDPGINSLPVLYPTQRPELSMSSQAFPEVGDITFDYDNRQIFATCMDDGKLYRFNMGGQKLSSFDPWVADTGATYGDGFARWGEAIWAAKYHRGRVYFSRWNEDFDKFSANTSNEVWSVAIDPTTDDFIPSSLRLEVTGSDLQFNYGGLGASATPPISDITFTSEGNPAQASMIIAERGMGGNWAPGSFIYEQMIYHATPVNPSDPVDAFTNTYPHRSRGRKYSCDPATGTWKLVNQTTRPEHFSLGAIGAGGENSAGGVDFDFNDRGCTGGTNGNRIWFTADAMSSPNGTWYGLQGLLPSGGWVPDSVIFDLNGLNTLADKSTFGDVETPCRVSDVAGLLILSHFTGSCEGIPVQVTLVNNAGSVVGTGVLDAIGNFRITVDVPDGMYDAYVKTRSHLVKRVNANMMGGHANLGNVPLIPGDIDGNNEIGPNDFTLLSAAFGSLEGDSNYLVDADLNGDGEVGPADFSLLIANFGEIGDSP